MSRIPTAEISPGLLNQLFDEFEIWLKIKEGRLTSETIAQVPSSHWLNATSMIIKHFKPGGKHIATTHCVKDGKGNVLHWDAKDLRIYEVCLWRA